MCLGVGFWDSLVVSLLVLMARLGFFKDFGFGGLGFSLSLGHFRVGSYRNKSLVEGLYTL